MQLLFASLLSLGVGTIGVAALQLSNHEFRISIDDDTGAILAISDPNATGGMNWVSSPDNAPWLPGGSLWGLGYSPGLKSQLKRTFWNKPQLSGYSDDSGTMLATYDHERVQVSVFRSFSGDGSSFTEKYVFKNMGNDTIKSWPESWGIYTPFNDHYTSSSDSLQNRSHAHIWAYGGSSAWVKLEQMGGHDRNLGLVITQGALTGYSIESRNTYTGSNTRGAVLLHPNITRLEPSEETTLEWTLFWHDDWEDFFTQCASRSDQFIKFDTPRHTLFPDESIAISMTGAYINHNTTANGTALECNGSSCIYTYTASATDLGERAVHISTLNNETMLNSTIYLNVAPSYDDLISARVKFIIEKQQVYDLNSPLHGAYVVYDNQMEAKVTFSDGNYGPGQERLGMGVLIARWLKNHPSEVARDSLLSYYNFVCTRLQDDTGFVFGDPPLNKTEAKEEGARLYNFPWVMQFHLAVAALNLQLPESLADKSPLQRFVMTMEIFYANNGTKLYPIGLPVLEGLRALHASGDSDLFQRGLSLFTSHAEHIVGRGVQYPPFEVHFEQSIVAPAAIVPLELYRWTGNRTFLEGAELQLKTLLRFAGKQPDYHLHGIAIRHWDGYWFGKDQMWGDVFPHYWSTLNALALHHYGKATGDSSYEKEADSIIRNNFALFDEQGRASCAWLYPTTVDGREAHYADSYANDQDWALAFLLEISEDNARTGKDGL